MLRVFLSARSELRPRAFDDFANASSIVDSVLRTTFFSVFGDFRAVRNSSDWTTDCNSYSDWIVERRCDFGVIFIFTYSEKINCSISSGSGFVDRRTIFFISFEILNNPKSSKMGNNKRNKK